MLGTIYRRIPEGWEYAGINLPEKKEAVSDFDTASSIYERIIPQNFHRIRNCVMHLGY